MPTPPKAGFRVVSTQPIALNSIGVKTGIIAVTSSASPAVIASGTPGMITGNQNGRVYLNMREGGHYGLYLNIDLLSFGQYFDISMTI